MAKLFTIFAHSGVIYLLMNTWDGFNPTAYLAGALFITIILYVD